MKEGLEDVDWEELRVPVKRCEFNRARKRFMTLGAKEVREIVTEALRLLPAEDREFILRNMTIPMDGATEKSAEIRSDFLWDLIRLIMWKYREYKLLFYKAVVNAELERAIFVQRRIFSCYEALRSLKKRLLGGKDIMYIDMPEYI
jgi:hypothetical protein